MVFEQARGGFVRIGAYDHVGREVVARIGSPLLRDALGFAERAAALNDDGLVPCRPILPGLHPGSLALLAFLLIEPVPLQAGRRCRASSKHRHEILHASPRVD